ncbi:MAG TPA: DUF805 domain-containing protein [Lutibacter sp.]
MFKNLFSFKGRIRRTEFGLTFIIFCILALIPFVNLFALFPLWAQGAKRCHDVGISGWWQLIPLCPIYLLFAKGNAGANTYGEDPKLLFVEEHNF